MKRKKLEEEDVDTAVSNSFSLFFNYGTFMSRVRENSRGAVIL